MKMIKRNNGNDIKIYATTLQNVNCFVPKRHNHDHFWIEDCILFESYNTIRGMRYNEIKQVPGMPDMDKCDEDTITYIANKYYS